MNLTVTFSAVKIIYYAVKIRYVKAIEG